MRRKAFIFTEAVVTAIEPERAERLADESLINIRLIESRKQGSFWIHEYEVKGEPGKVERFLERLHDIERRIK